MMDFFSSSLAAAACALGLAALTCCGGTIDVVSGPASPDSIAGDADQAGDASASFEASLGDSGTVSEASADSGASADGPLECADAPILTSLGGGSRVSPAAPCELRELHGSNLHCAGTRVFFSEAAEGRADDEAVIVPSSGRELHVRLPLVEDKSYLSVLVTRGLHKAVLPLTPPVKIIHAAMGNGGGCPAGPRPVCNYRPTPTTPNEFTPKVGTDCSTVILLADGIGCAGVSVKLGDKPVQIVDAYLGLSRLAVRLPTRMTKGPAAFSITTVDGHVTTTSGIFHVVDWCTN